jgi:hypothetical protein
LKCFKRILQYCWSAWASRNCHLWILNIYSWGSASRGISRSKLQYHKTSVFFCLLYQIIKRYPFWEVGCLM